MNDPLFALFLAFIAGALTTLLVILHTLPKPK
jgi:hypothetical protein